MGKKKKILLVCTRKSIFSEPYCRALTNLDFEVSLFDYRNNLFYYSSFVRKLIQLIPKIKYRAWKSINQKLLSTIKKNKPDYLFVIKGENITPETINKIKKCGITTINRFTDSTSHWDLIKRLAPFYNYFFTFDPYILKKLKEDKRLTNCYYLPFAADLDKDACFPVQRKYQYDISFIGSYEPKLHDDRVEYLSRLADLDLHIWGNKNWLKSPLSKFYRGRAKDDEIPQIYRKSKIVINIAQQIAEEEGINLRPFEATAAGSFLLSDSIKDDIRRLFIEGKEVVVFKDADDLRSKVEYYLIHEEEREKIARAGFERTKKDHTYRDRFSQMFNIINS